MSLSTDAKSCESWAEFVQTDSQDRKRLLVIYFSGVSCMGKSELLKRFEFKFVEKNIACHKVSLDKVAKVIMDRYKTDQNYTGEEAFTLCMDKIFPAFHDKVVETLDSIGDSHGVLMVDDCTLDQSVFGRILDKAGALNLETKFFRLYPSKNAGFKIDHHIQLHLSFQCILNLCYRALNRAHHDTFNYTQEKKLQLVLSFVRVYENQEDFNCKDSAFTQNNHALLDIEFHHEKDITDLSAEAEEIMNTLKACLLAIVPFESPVKTGLDELKKLSRVINRADSHELKQLISYGRSDVWEKKFDQLASYFD